MVGRTGAKGVSIRWSDDEEPTVYMAVGSWSVNEGTYYEVGASFDPIEAMWSLLEKALDGGTCQHCHRPTGVERELEGAAEIGGLNLLVCWYVYDPELKTFRKSCD